METESENKNDNPEEEVNSEPKIAEEEAHDVKSEKEDLDSEATPENLSKKIQETYAQNEDWQDKYIRVLADLENLKRRQIKEREDAVQRTRSQIFGDLLPSLDAFRMGMHEVEKDETTKNIFVGKGRDPNNFATVFNIPKKMVKGKNFYEKLYLIVIHDKIYLI